MKTNTACDRFGPSPVAADKGQCLQYDGTQMTQLGSQAWLRGMPGCLPVPIFCLLTSLSLGWEAQRGQPEQHSISEAGEREKTKSVSHSFVQ